VTMSWTLHKPTKSGWYWFREPGRSLDRPMPVWVYQSGEVFYVQFCGAHEDFDDKRLDDLKGEWAGPITPPPVFEERESNP
jgi:hypothetical protein